MKGTLKRIFIRVALDMALVFVLCGVCHGLSDTLAVAL